MFNRLNHHLKTNNMLVPERFRIRKGITIQKAIFSVTNNILTALHQQQVGDIFCILAKTFDHVSHKILLGKLFYCEIRGVNIQLFELYIACRKQNIGIISQNHRQKFSSQ